MKSIYRVTRDLHLYAGLFLTPLILVFAVSVFFLVHAWIPGKSSSPPTTRTATGLPLPGGIEKLAGREQANALRPALERLGVRGEVGAIRPLSRHRLNLAVIVPGKEVGVDFDLEARSAVVTERAGNFWSALVYLHKMPGQHLANLRGNWVYMRIWRWLADGTVYLVMFLSISGIYLWAVLRAERRVGLALIAAGALSFCGLIYAVVR